MGTWIKSKRGQRLRDRTISDLEQWRSTRGSATFRFTLLTSWFSNGFLAALGSNRSYDRSLVRCSRKSLPGLQNLDEDHRKRLVSRRDLLLLLYLSPFPSLFVIFDSFRADRYFLGMVLFAIHFFLRQDGLWSVLFFKFNASLCLQCNGECFMDHSRLSVMIRSMIFGLIFLRRMFYDS